MVLSLRSKYLSLLVLLVICAVSAGTWFHVKSTFKARKQEMEARATSLARFVGLKFTDEFLKEKEKSVDQDSPIKFWIDEVDDADFIEVYNTHGDIILSHAEQGAEIPAARKISSSFIQKIFSGDNNFLARRIAGQKVVDFLVPVTLFDTEIGLVRLGLDASRYYNQREKILYTNARYGFVLLLIITLIGYAATPYLIGPIKQLSNVADRFRQGDFDVRSVVNSGDEIEELSDHFNRMASQIQNLVQSLSKAGNLHRIFPYIIVPNQLYGKIVDQVQNNVGSDYVGLVLDDEDKETSSVMKFTAGPEGVKATNTSSFNQELFEELADLSQGDDMNNIVNRSNQAQELAGFFPSGDRKILSDALVFRLERDEKLGYLVTAMNHRDFTDSEIQLFTSLLSQIETVIFNAQNFEGVLVDERTGLYPRKVMHLALREAGELAESSNLWLARISAVGSDVEQDRHLDVASFLNDQRKRISPLNDTDHFFIVSHDESEQFLAVLSGWSKNETTSIFETITRRLNTNEMKFSGLSLNVGLVSISDDENMESLLDRCGRQLRKAKDQGGNHVCSEN